MSFKKEYLWLRNMVINSFWKRDIPKDMDLSGVRFGHHGIGVIINRQARFGKNVFVGNHVVIGGRKSFDGKGWSFVGSPVICDDVRICSHSCIVGNVTVGRGSVVGAGAVVTRDVPPFSLVVEYDRVFRNKYVKE